MKKIYLVFTTVILTAALNAQYCSPTFANGCFNWRNIAVSVDDIDFEFDEVDCTISDYTSLTTSSIQPGETINMSVICGVWCGVGVWVDFNDDYAFSDDENLYYNYVGNDPSYTYEFPITIPNGSTWGAHRMRVIAGWGSDCYSSTNKNGYGPCGSYQYGNFNDFTLEVGSGIDVTEQVSASILDVTAFPNPATETVVVSTNQQYALDGIHIFNMQGELVKQLKITTGGSRVTVDIMDLAAGVYYLNCISGDRQRTVKVTKL